MEAEYICFDVLNSVHNTMCSCKHLERLMTLSEEEFFHIKRFIKITLCLK